MERIVFLSSGGRCAICKTRVYDIDGNGGGGATFFQIAHVRGLNPGSARYDQDMTDNERNSAENLILLCPTDHSKVDNDETRYTVDYLVRIRREHIKWVDEKLGVEGSKLTFSELEVVIRFLEMDDSFIANSDFNVLPVNEKIIKNNLSEEVRALITRGLIQVKQVKDYLAIQPDVDFGNRLRNRFVKEYNELLDMGIKGDQLFYDLYAFATNGGKGDLLYMAGGLAVLVYFFESCEVFEK